MLKKGTTTIKIDGNEYKFSFNFGTLKLIQKMNKELKIQDIFNLISEQDLEMLSHLTYCGVKVNHADFKMETIDNMSLFELTEIFEALGEMFNETLPKADDEEKK